MDFFFKILSLSVFLLCVFVVGYGGIALSDCVVLPYFSEALAYAIKMDNQGSEIDVRNGREEKWKDDDARERKEEKEGEGDREETG